MRKFDLSPFFVFLIPVFIGCSHIESKSFAQDSRPPAVLSSFLVATVQYPMEGGLSAPAFIRKVESFVREAKNRKAKLVVFPELIALDSWPVDSKDPEAVIVSKIADQITPAFFRAIERMSREYDLAILAGSAPRRVGSKLRNTALLAMPDGKKFTHDKVFLTAWERKMGWEAGNEITPFDAPWGKTVLLICYDSEFPVMAEALARAKPEVLLIPSMTETAAGLQRVRWSAQARAVELHAYVIVSGTVGKVGGDWFHFGQNSFITPRDRLFPESPIEGVLGAPGIVMGSIDIVRLRKSREETEFFPARDQRGREVKVNPTW
ncbi:MAG: hypothetical protein H7301_02700 [Cryobacterium sp.]|nr:hypothetical protein [Oligoflexia bacterium]